MQNTNDWETTLAGLALAVAAIGKEHEPSEILEGMARALALVGKALTEDGDEEQQAAILGHMQGALQEGFDGVTVETAEGMFMGFSNTGAEAVDTAQALLEQTKLMLAELSAGQPVH
jgi:hypothetical protein